MTEQLLEQEVEAEPVATGPIRVSWAMVPKVNLLPLEIIEARGFRKTQALLGVGVLAAVLVGVAGTVWAQRGISDANDQLASAQSRISVLQAEQARYAEAPRVIKQVQAAQDSLTLAMGNDVLWYRYLTEVQDAQPSGVVLTSIAISLAGREAEVGSSNPLTPNGIGTVALSATADQYRDAAALLPALNRITGFSVTSLGTASGAIGAPGTAGVTFTSNVVIDSDALSRRYAKEAD
jgi:Tfp pilus assembly protein PilN